MRCTSTRVLPLPAPASTRQVAGRRGDRLALGVVEGIENIGDVVIMAGFYQRGAPARRFAVGRRRSPGAVESGRADRWCIAPGDPCP